MKLIIDIPKKEYQFIINEGFMEHTHGKMCYEAIKNGTPLKGHGRLIDESKITKCEQIGLVIKDDNVTHCLITDAPTIIEAERYDE